MNTTFKKPRTVFIGGNGNIKRIGIGGDFPVSVQTMWKDGIIEIADNPEALTNLIKKINYKFKTKNLKNQKKNHFNKKTIKKQ